MARFKTLLTGNEIALLALVLSVISSISALYQWWSGGREEKIRAAVDMSDRYLEHALDIETTRGEINAGQAGNEELAAVRAQEAKLEYAAFLANHGLLDWKYLAQRLTCDMATSINNEGVEAKIFIDAHPEACTSGSQAEKNEDSEENEDSEKNKDKISSQSK